MPNRFENTLIAKTLTGKVKGSKVELIDMNKQPITRFGVNRIGLKRVEGGSELSIGPFGPWDSEEEVTVYGIRVTFKDRDVRIFPFPNGPLPITKGQSVHMDQQMS